MKKLLFSIVALLGLSFSSFSQTYVDGYFKKDGSYVQGHYRNTSPTTSNNNNIYGTSSYPLPTNNNTSRNVDLESLYNKLNTPSNNETYTRPQISSFDLPKADRQLSFPTYPTTKSGAPDMRYKENKALYSNPFSF